MNRTTATCRWCSELGDPYLDSTERTARLATEAQRARGFLRCLSRNQCSLHLLLNNFEAHLDFSSVYSVSPWLNDLFSAESILSYEEEWKAV